MGVAAVGRGAERYPTGEIYVGEYAAGERCGKGTFKHANGQTLVSMWKDNRPVGEGVQWCAAPLRERSTPPPFH